VVHCELWVNKGRMWRLRSCIQRCGEKRFEGSLIFGVKLRE
jgi:hypothetical protein